MSTKSVRLEISVFTLSFRRDGKVIALICRSGIDFEVNREVSDMKFALDTLEKTLL